MIEQAAAEIQHVARVGTLEMALSIGEIVFRRIFHGDAELLRLNGPKEVSFTQLADRSDLGISRANLWRAVGIYELSLRHPQLRESKHLGVTHVRAVLGLPARDQDRLLARAERERLGAAAIETAAACARKGHGGRPRKLEVVRALDALYRVTKMPVDAFSDQRAVKKIAAEEIDVYIAMLEDLDERLGVLRALLREAANRT
ncbi:MAG: hypothetical protein IPI67_00505 [Myxococcales bacterium]|nr:hypothetical protein [Myxococcales bacterium]